MSTVVVVLMALIFAGICLLSWQLMAIATRLTALLSVARDSAGGEMVGGGQESVAALMSVPWEADLEDPGTLGGALASALDDVGIIKRRLSYLWMIASDLRSIEAYVRTNLGIDPASLTSDDKVPFDRLAILRELEMEVPLDAGREDEKMRLDSFVRDWVERADVDEFDALVD